MTTILLAEPNSDNNSAAYTTHEHELTVSQVQYSTTFMFAEHGDTSFLKIYFDEKQLGEIGLGAEVCLLVRGETHRWRSRPEIGAGHALNRAARTIAVGDVLRVKISRSPMPTAPREREAWAVRRVKLVSILRRFLVDDAKAKQRLKELTRPRAGLDVDLINDWNDRAPRTMHEFLEKSDIYNRLRSHYNICICAKTAGSTMLDLPVILGRNGEALNSIAAYGDRVPLNRMNVVFATAQYFFINRALKSGLDALSPGIDISRFVVSAVEKMHEARNYDLKRYVDPIEIDWRDAAERAKRT